MHLVCGDFDNLFISMHMFAMLCLHTVVSQLLRSAGLANSALGLVDSTLSFMDNTLGLCITQWA